MPRRTNEELETFAGRARELVRDCAIAETADVLVYEFGISKARALRIARYARMGQMSIVSRRAG